MFLSPDRIRNIKDLIVKILTQSSVSLLPLSQLLEKMVSYFSIVPWARRHSYPLQWFLLPYQRQHWSNMTNKVYLPPQVHLSLRWWQSPAILRGCHFLDLDQTVLTTDASLHGRGGHLLNQVAQGQWSSAEKLNSINFLELQVIRLALYHFRPTLEGCHILVLMDNTLAKAHINREGGTRSQTLMVKLARLFSWAEQYLLLIRADHISGIANV